MWTYDTRLDGGPRSFHGDPLLYQKSVVVVSDRGCGQGDVYAFEPASGKVRWKLQASAATGFARIDNTIFFGTRDDEWLAVDLDSGEVRWRIKPDHPDPQCQIGTAPVTDGVTLVFLDHAGTIHAVNAASGETLWQQKPSLPVTSSLFMYKDVLYFSSGKRVIGLEPASGKKLVELETPAVVRGRFAWSAVGDSEIEYAFGVQQPKGRNLGVLFAFSDEFERVLWSREAGQEWVSEQPHVWKDWIIAGNCQGDLAAYRASDGVPAWSYHVQGCIRSFGHDDSTLYVGVQEGTIYALLVGTPPRARVPAKKPE